MIDLNQKWTGISRTKTCKIKPDGDSKESKTINLVISYDEVTGEDVLGKAVRSDVIAWQNGPGRKNFDSWKDKQVVRISAKAPGKTLVDVKAAFRETWKTMSREEREAYLEKLEEEE